jgi:hypothetical protein
MVGYQSHEKKRTRLKIVFVLGTFVLGFFTATQHFALTAAYDPALGAHLHRVYFPGMIVLWTRKWFDLYPEELRTSISYGMAASALMLLAYLIIGRFVVQSARGNDKLHGTAHWASPKELRETGLLGNDEGVYVGAWEDKKGRIHYLRDNGPSHVLCFAPTRSGKGVGLVLPTLLSWKQSTVISDLKGELWQLTSGWRKRYAGNLVFRFEPGSPERSARWNPLDEVRLLSHLVDDPADYFAQRVAKNRAASVANSRYQCGRQIACTAATHLRQQQTVRRKTKYEATHGVRLASAYPGNIADRHPTVYFSRLRNCRRYEAYEMSLDRQGHVRLRSVIPVCRRAARVQQKRRREYGDIHDGRLRSHGCRNDSDIPYWHVHGADHAMPDRHVSCGHDSLGADGIGGDYEFPLFQSPFAEGLP